MKKKIFALVISVVLIAAMACPAFAADQDISFSTMVLDDAGLLTQAQLDELDARAWEPFQYSGLENSRHYIVHGVTKGQT